MSFNECDSFLNGQATAPAYWLSLWSSTIVRSEEFVLTPTGFIVMYVILVCESDVTYRLNVIFKLSKTWHEGRPSHHNVTKVHIQPTFEVFGKK